MKNVKRQIILDTETTGMNKRGIPHQGHRIIEIGAVEIINRRVTKNNFHVYLNPDRSIDFEAFKVHGISLEFLEDKPRFREIAHNFFNYIKNSELIIHHATFDVGFINYEFKKINNNFSKIQDFCGIIDTLSIARKLFPGKKNNLDALCTRYSINNRDRTFHSALLDAQLLADIFLLMTGKQHFLPFIKKKKLNSNKNNKTINFFTLPVLKANFQEIKKHHEYLKFIENQYGICMWKYNII